MLIRKAITGVFGAAVLLSPMVVVAQAGPIDLFKYSLNIDGTVSDVIVNYVPSDPLPPGVDDSGFNNDTGLGSIAITITGAGPHSYLAFFDHELDETVNTYFNEYGGTGGTAAAGQSWEIDEPDFVFGNIYSNFLNNTLENTNNLPLADADDVAMAMGWNFTLAAFETAEITFTVGETNPGGFWLSQNDNLSATQIFLSSALEITGNADADGDGVFGDDDICDDTVIPEGVPSIKLRNNRWALVDGDFDFDTKRPPGRVPNRSYSTADTGGCSCEQIIAAQGLEDGQTKFGCSKGVMDDWVLWVISP